MTVRRTVSLYSLESAVLLFREDVEIFLVDSIEFSSSVRPLVPRVLHVGLNLLGGDDHFAGNQGEECAVSSHSNL